MGMGAREPEMTEGLYRAEHGVCIYSYKNYVPFAAGNRMGGGTRDLVNTIT